MKLFDLLVSSAWKIIPSDIEIAIRSNRLKKLDAELIALENIKHRFCQGRTNKLANDYFRQELLYLRESIQFNRVQIARLQHK
ncbi:hypothetical protein JCM19241_4243 [Vibrio ishigakensis]|uniref:Uncharacterized protein n=1 Tax=Vibrio ishigakensis TaxID=1481914 RepID=A0A0B8QDF8_9VIBR|nr:hypothetical protein JCM19241_4243 [Vibrio ishigakensis]